MKNNNRGIVKRIVDLKKQALEHRMFGETEKMKACYKAKEELVMKYGCPKEIHKISGMEMVAYEIFKRTFHVPIKAVSTETIKRLKENKGFKYKVGMKY